MTDQQLRDVSESDAPSEPPRAQRAPERRTMHGDVFADPYAWMRDRTSQQTREFIDAQNAYCEQRMKPLAGLRRTLFDELKSRVQQTDMSVPTRIDDYWYFTRTIEGAQYAVQCRIPVRGADDWEPPHVEQGSAPGSMPDEQIVFDMNAEAKGHDFFRIGGMDISRDGRWMLYGVDSTGDERYDFRIRDLATGRDLPDFMPSIGGACLTPDGSWVFYMALDDAWRPYAVWRHRVGAPSETDVEVFHEHDERFWVGVGLSFDERNVVIGTGSKTSSEVLLLPVATPEGRFEAFIPRAEDVEYDVSFSCFEGAGEHGEDVPVAVVCHNAVNPNFEIDVVDMRSHRPPFRLGEGMQVAAGSPYGCERGGAVQAGAAARPISDAAHIAGNPGILDGARGLAIESMAIHRHFVTLGYRADGLPRVAVMGKADAAADFLAGRPWRFRELIPPALDGDWDAPDGGVAPGTDGGDATDCDEPSAMSALDGRTHRLYSIGAAGNPSYDAPRMRYSFSSFTRPGELRELDPVTGRDVLLKRAKVLGDFDARDYMERRVWITARDGERIPVSLVWRRGRLSCPAPMFITGYGAYEISSDPGFSVARLSMLDRGVLYAVPHVRGGGEMGRAWYEQGRKLHKMNTFIDFVDATAALQRAGYADPRHTVANGGSAGGLLMGAVANMAPECYAGIEADVPFVDALTSILDPDLPLTVTEWDEWGDPLHDPEVYRYMKSYTPYENAPLTVADAVDFPRIFITTSMNDTRVLYVEPLKWLARLQAAGVDAVAKIEVEAGHGGISGRYKQWEEVSYENAWCMDVMHLAR